MKDEYDTTHYYLPNVWQQQNQEGAAKLDGRIPRADLHGSLSRVF